MMKEILLLLLASFLVAIGCSGSAPAQNRTGLTGTISDELGSSIVGATITLISSDGAQRSSTSNVEGRYSFTDLAPGKFKMRVSAKGFATSGEMEINVTSPSQIRINVTLKVAAIESQVQVNTDSGLSTEPSGNANKLLITGRDLEALPDDPSD
ncbi:MAG TPA: carboxypeptidase-like regulatory domain-containing protein, partial [Pyrinomonadaceae bacterium]|nr:carboxypeptidase-like regulatory domain-containing protein [Pyrinomonadaceae bacterium]